jgi:hypothetical protein
MMGRRKFDGNDGNDETDGSDEVRCMCTGKPLLRCVLHVPNILHVAPNVPIYPISLMIPIPPIAPVRPASAFVAEGSEVAVYRGTRLKE